MICPNTTNNITPSAFHHQIVECPDKDTTTTLYVLLQTNTYYNTICQCIHSKTDDDTYYPCVLYSTTKTKYQLNILPSIHYYTCLHNTEQVNTNFTYSYDILRRGGRQERIFVALFDYDPPTMSPNPEACDEELPFREGQLIKVRNVINDDQDSDVIAKIAFLNKVETEQFCTQKILFWVSSTLGSFRFFSNKIEQSAKSLCHPDLNQIYIHMHEKGREGPIPNSCK